MMSQTPELDLIKQRLEKLERENRRLKSAGWLALLVVAAALLMAQGKYNRRIEAEEFILTDSHGSERAELAWKDASPRLVLLDTHGKAQPAAEATLPAAGGGASKVVRSDVEPHAAVRELTDSGSPAPAPTAHAQGDQPTVVDLPAAPSSTRAAFPAEPGAEASSPEWDADAASLPVSDTPHQATGSHANDRYQPATLPAGPRDPLRAALVLPVNPQAGMLPSNFPAAKETPVEARASRPLSSPANPPGAPDTSSKPVGAPALPGPLAQLEKPLDAGAAWPPTSVAAVASADRSNVIAADPGVLPPSVALKVMGYADKPGRGREIFIAEDSEVFVVHEGDLFADRYRVLKISATEVELEDETRRERFKLSFHP